MRGRSAAALPLLAAAALAGCDTPGLFGPPSGGVVARGAVASIHLRGAAREVHVAPHAAPRERCAVVATATRRTRVFRRTAAGDLRPAPLGTVTVGDTVEVYADMVFDSCPAQAQATALVLAPRAGGGR